MIRGSALYVGLLFYSLWIWVANTSPFVVRHSSIASLSVLSGGPEIFM
jgi:hypothetical protein